MSHLKHVMKNIKQNTEVPEKVITKLDDVLDHLPDRTENDIPQKRRWPKEAVAAACALAAGTCIFYSNPALAAKLPFVGKIFAEVENEVSFSGDYSKKAETLGTVKSGQSAESGQTGTGNHSELAAEDSASKQTADGNASALTAETEISASDHGITITASEVYCDGLSIFLTTQVTAESGGLSNLPKHYTGNGDTTAGTIYLKGEWNVAGSGGTRTLVNNNLEGKVLDDHTFIGMLKLDLNEYSSENSTLSLNLSRIGWDDLNMQGSEDVSASCQTEGLWTFDVPFTVDARSAKEYAVNKTENGYTLKNVFVSPYQVVSYVEMPEETYPCTLICDQDGKPLDYTNPTDSPYGKTVFAVNGREFSSLHVYVFDTFEAYDEAEQSGRNSTDKCIDMDIAAEKAVISAEINVK